MTTYEFKLEHKNDQLPDAQGSATVVSDGETWMDALKGVRQSYSSREWTVTDSKIVKVRGW